MQQLISEMPAAPLEQPRLQTLYYSFIQTGSTNGANVPESLSDAKHDLKLLASQQAAINRECRHSAKLSLADIPQSSVSSPLLRGIAWSSCCATLRTDRCD